MTVESPQSTVPREDCATCEGRGLVIIYQYGIQAVCCGHGTRWGDCCGSPVPEQTDESYEASCPECFPPEAMTDAA